MRIFLVFYILLLATSTSSSEMKSMRAEEHAAWQAFFQKEYQHYRKVDVSIDALDDFSLCHTAELMKMAKELFEPWRIRVSLKPHDPQLFPRAWIVIHRLKPNKDGYALYRKAGQVKDTPQPCISKSSHLIVVWDQYLLEWRTGCAAGKMVYYEIADLFEALRRKDDSIPLPKEAVFSPCGRMQVIFHNVENLRLEATKSRSFWGKTFPQARIEAKKATDNRIRRSIMNRGNSD